MPKSVLAVLILGSAVFAAAQGFDHRVNRAEWLLSGHDFANSCSQPAEVLIGPGNVPGYFVLAQLRGTRRSRYPSVVST
jgi:hypothetical protein